MDTVEEAARQELERAGLMSCDKNAVDTLHSCNQDKLVSTGADLLPILSSINVKNNTPTLTGVQEVDHRGVKSALGAGGRSDLRVTNPAHRSVSKRLR